MFKSLILGKNLTGLFLVKQHQLIYVFSFFVHAISPLCTWRERERGTCQVNKGLGRNAFTYSPNKEPPHLRSSCVESIPGRIRNFAEWCSFPKKRDCRQYSSSSSRAD